MKKTILTILITLFAIVAYSQTVTVHTTLLRINGVEKGQLMMDKILPIAWEYQFIITDTLDWTTIPIDSLIVQNDSLQMQIDLLLYQLDNLTQQINSIVDQLSFKVDYDNLDIIIGEVKIQKK